METLANQLLAVGLEIKQSEEYKNPPDFVYLRNLEDFCNNRLFQTDDKNEQLICFIITRFIKSFFSNLGGDTPYDVEVHNSRINFYNVLSDVFTKMGNAMKEDKPTKYFDQLAELISKYIGMINYLNKNF